MKKPFANVDFTAFLACCIAGGIGGGILAGALQMSGLGVTAATCIFIVYVSAVITAGYFANRAIQRRLQRKIESLRAAGILPDAATQSDADVIRLANDEKREAAALLYRDIHGGQLEIARFVVGADRLGKVNLGLMVLVLAVFIAAVFHDAITGELHNRTSSICVMISLVVVNIVAFWVRAKRVKWNREKLAGGILPKPQSACLFNKC